MNTARAPIVRRRAPRLGVLLVLLLVAAPLLLLGYPRGHDWRLELARTAATSTAFAEGQLPPRWAGDFYGGFGSPVLLFYAPLAPTLGALATLLTGSVVRGSAWVVGLTLLVAAWGGARLGRALVPDLGRGVSLGAVLLVLSPYLLTNLYLRNAGSEALALALTPFVLAAALERDRGGGWRALACWWAVLVLSHNLSALLVGVMLAVLTISLGGPAPRRWQGIALAFSFGLALSAWFWLPVALLGPAVRLDELGRDKFDALANLERGVPQIALDGRPNVGPVIWLALAAGIVVWRTAHSAERRRSAAIGSAGAVALLVLMHPVSAPLWRHLPGLALLQFPWRLLGPLGIVSVWLVLLALAELSARHPRAGRWVTAAAVLVHVVLALVPLGVVRPLESPAAIEAALRPASMRERLERATVGHEMLPRRADLDVVASWGGDLARLKGWSALGLLEVEDRGARLRIELESEGGELELRRWWFPGWRATLGGTPLPLQTTETGLVACLLPPGRHQLELELPTPASRRLGLAIAALALLGLAWLRLHESAPTPEQLPNPESRIPDPHP